MKWVLLLLLIGRPFPILLFAFEEMDTVLYSFRPGK